MAGATIAARLQRDYLSPIGLDVDIAAMRPSISMGPDEIALLSAPLDPNPGAFRFPTDKGLLPLYLLPAYFVHHAAIHGVKIGVGGVAIFENAWRVE